MRKTRSSNSFWLKGTLLVTLLSTSALIFPGCFNRQQEEHLIKYPTKTIQDYERHFIVNFPGGCQPLAELDSGGTDGIGYHLSTDLKQETEVKHFCSIAIGASPRDLELKPEMLDSILQKVVEHLESEYNTTVKDLTTGEEAGTTFAELYYKRQMKAQKGGEPKPFFIREMRFFKQNRMYTVTFGSQEQAELTGDMPTRFFESFRAL